MSFVPRVQAVPGGVVNLADYAALARGALDSAAWAYLNGGAGDELTVAANMAAWQRFRMLPRVLRPMAGGHTRLELLGRTLAHPILLAPVAFQRLAHEDGELASAHAAASQQAGLIVSAQASVRLEDVAAAVRDEAGRGPLWFQLYLQSDRAATLELVRRSERAGYEALVLTVDAPVHGARDAERRSGFRLPRGISAVNLPPTRNAQPAHGLFEHLAAAPTWSELEWLAARTTLPVLLKGVLHVEDARQALACGARGVIVSNHGGRTLDTAVTTAEVLAEVVQALGGAAPVLVDGGIRRGTDVLKAMALGASAVLIGRPVVWALASAGAVGVAHALRLLRDELEIAMALCGCATLAQAGPALIRRGD